MFRRTLRTTLCAAVVTLAGAVAHGQSFDVATVRPNPGGKGKGDLAVTHGTLTIRNLALRDMIAFAYSVADYQVSGPLWLRQDRFNIAAKADSPETGEDEMRPLLQKLLAERFHLAAHRETRQLSAYVLVAAKRGPTLHPADPGGAAMPFKKANKADVGRIHSDSMTMPQFAEVLSRRLGYPVQDMTGLKGAYRIRLEWTAENQPQKIKTGKPAKDHDQPSIFTALQEQMGLRLEARKTAVEVYVIDRIDRSPTEN